MRWRTANNHRRAKLRRWYLPPMGKGFYLQSAEPMMYQAGDIIMCGYGADGYSVTIVREGQPDQVYAMTRYESLTPGYWECEGAGSASISYEPPSGFEPLVETISPR